jgi:hypothetical protein
VAEHTLPEGKEWIEGLLALGRALKYEARDEFDVSAVGEPEAPVDVAWFRSARDEFPLFIYEVETRPAAQLVDNAAKVFSQKTELFEKPLFHFQLVLTGQGESGRVKHAERLFGAFNYRLYNVAGSDGGTSALCDILSQHRRVSNQLDVRDFAGCLAADIWSGLDHDAIWQHAEACDFSTPWAQSYAELALRDAAFLPRYLRIAERRLDNEEALGEEYGSFVGEHCGPAIEAAVLAHERPELAEVCLKQMDRWQEGDGTIKAVGPYFGRQDYDDFVVALMPGVWGLLAALTPRVPGARLWILEQMELVVGKPNVGFNFAALTAVWMIHIAAGGGDECEHHFEMARERLNSEGGISPAILAEPPTLGGQMEGMGEWRERLRQGANPIPGLAEFRERIAATGETSPVEVALHYLLDAEPPRNGAAIRVALAGDQQGGRPS